MSFLETPRFPLRASYGAVGGPEFATDIVEVNSGQEQRNIRWDQARAKFYDRSQGHGRKESPLNRP